jgi:hypothetical protein
MDDPETIPVKSLSLRKTSVKKRLETEGKRKQPRTKGKLSKKARLSKYRRKSANAKERERMKKQNDVFEVLKEILPCDKAIKVEEDKETKVSFEQTNVSIPSPDLLLTGVDPPLRHRVHPLLAVPPGGLRGGPPGP